MAAIWLDTPVNLKSKRVFVAGHGGMVGSALVRKLAGEGCAVLTAARGALDLRNQVAVRNWMNTNKPDVVVVAAAKVGGIGANAASPADFYYDNTMIATNIIHSAYETEVERLLFLGSSCIYPRDCQQPIKEEYLLSGALEKTNEAYAIAKIGALKMAQYYRAQHGCDFISAMPCNLYGEGDTYDEENSHVIPALIMKAHAAKMAGEKTLSVWGSGKPLREFLHVDDLADALVYILRNYDDAEHINVGSGEEVSIRVLAETICEVVGFRGSVEFDAGRPDGTPRKIMDNTKLSERGWMPTISLEEGISLAYDDYLERYARLTRSA